MNRGALLFLFFCVVLVVSSAVGALVLGKHKLSFIFHDGRSSEPVVMMSFAHADLQGGVSAFYADLDVLLHESDAERLWSGRVTSVLHGREQDAWSVIVLSRYPSRSRFIKQYTRSSYELPFGISVAQQGQPLLMAAEKESAFEFNAGIYLLELMQLAPEHAAQEQHLVSEQIVAEGVQSVWLASLNPLSGSSDQEWQVVKMTGFKNRQFLNDWLDNIERKTEASLRQRYYRRYVSLVVESF